jgi:hypothetical protein
MLYRLIYLNRPNNGVFFTILSYKLQNILNKFCVKYEILRLYNHYQIMALY